MRILHGDCLALLPTIADNSIDAIVTDPPYHLIQAKKACSKRGAYARITAGFMNQLWDGGDIAFRPDVWEQCLRVLKPGGHIAVFGGSRTHHRVWVAVEDAGFEIRDTLMWLYGSGFPKSLDVSKAIDKHLGAEREIVGNKTRKAKFTQNHAGTGKGEGNINGGYNYGHGEIPQTAPASPKAEQWQGWGTALKPSHEEVVIAQKPYDLPSLCAILAQKIFEAVCQLPLLVKAAEMSSALDLADAIAPDSVLWHAVVACNTPDDLCDLMDTLPLDVVKPSSLNIVSSWLDILAALSKRASTFTTETASSLITDLKILKSSLSLITPNVIAEAATYQNGIAPNASIVVHIFNALSSRLAIIRELSVPGNATNSPVICFQDAVDKLRPSHEPILLARKPLEGHTVAQNVLEHGTGALNIDACRVGTDVRINTPGSTKPRVAMGGGWRDDAEPTIAAGRWPPNLLLDGSDEVVECFPSLHGSGNKKDINTGTDATYDASSYHVSYAGRANRDYGGASGSAARFFPALGYTDDERRVKYCPKASKRDRAGSSHPTVKPIKLIEWLCKLITPPGGTILDPFAGSGTTGQAALNLGFDVIMIERETEYYNDILARFQPTTIG